MCEYKSIFWHKPEMPTIPTLAAKKLGFLSVNLFSLSSLPCFHLKEGYSAHWWFLSNLEAPLLSPSMTFHCSTDIIVVSIPMNLIALNSSFSLFTFQEVSRLWNRLRAHQNFLNPLLTDWIQPPTLRHPRSAANLKTSAFDFGNDFVTKTYLYILRWNNLRLVARFWWKHPWLNIKGITLYWRTFKGVAYGRISIPKIEWHGTIINASRWKLVKM